MLICEKYPADFDFSDFTEAEKLALLAILSANRVKSIPEARRELADSFCKCISSREKVTHCIQNLKSYDSPSPETHLIIERAISFLSGSVLPLCEQEVVPVPSSFPPWGGTPTGLTCGGTL